MRILCKLLAHVTCSTATGSRRAVVLLALLCAAGNVAADGGPELTWAKFRGPHGNGVAGDSESLPIRWSATENVRWVVEVPGLGWSQPLIVGERVFVTTVVADEPGVQPDKGLYLGQGVREPAAGVHHWLVLAFDRTTGALLWQQEAHAGRPKVPRHPKSSYAAETPVCDGERLYVLFGDLGLWCYDLNGQQLWTKWIYPKRTRADYGAAASPALSGNRLFFVYDNEVASYLEAFDAVSGESLWRTERDERTTWATPYVWKTPGRIELVVAGERKNRSYDLDGNVLWEFDGGMSKLVIPTPFAAGGLLYLTSGYIGDHRRPIFAVRPGAVGDLTMQADDQVNRFIAWSLPKAGPYNPSPIVYGGRFFTLHDRGFLTCHSASNGNEIYGRKRFPSGASFTASPWAYNGYVFCLSEEGTTYAIDPGDDFAIIAENPLDELSLASPAVGRNELIIRTASKLYCFEAVNGG